MWLLEVLPPMCAAEAPSICTCGIRMWLHGVLPPMCAAEAPSICTCGIRMWLHGVLPTMCAAEAPSICTCGGHTWLHWVLPPTCAAEAPPICTCGGHMWLHGMHTCWRRQARWIHSLLACRYIPHHFISWLSSTASKYRTFPLCHIAFVNFHWPPRGVHHYTQRLPLSHS